MILKSLSALALGVCAVAAHADTSFTFTLNNGNYPAITATTPDQFNFTIDVPYISTPNVEQQVGNATIDTRLLFFATGIDFAGKDADVVTTETIFDGTSFLSGTYAALFYNDYPMRLTGIPEGSGLEGTLVISQTTPEPSSLLLLGTGAVGVCATMRRRLGLRV